MTAAGRRDAGAVSDLGDAEYVQADLTAPGEAPALVERARPDRVFHLAAAASVAESWRYPSRTIETNVLATSNLLEALRVAGATTRVLVASSGEVYGRVAPDRLPVGEDEPLRPTNPYATSKAMCDILAAGHAEAFGMHIVSMRAFNQAGPRQAPTYAIARFAKSIALAEATGDPVVTTGDLSVRRDFTDVRDVVRAHWLALEHARPGPYNVCSGDMVALGDVFAQLAERSTVAIEQRTDRGLLRPDDVEEMRGANERLREATGWQPEISLERTLDDTLAWWRERTAAGATA